MDNTPDTPDTDTPKPPKAKAKCNCGCGAKKWFVLIAALAVLSLFAWDMVLKDRFVAKNFGEVEPGKIYRSGQLSQYMSRKTLDDKKIDVVIDLTGEEPDNPDEQAEIAACKDLGVTRYVFGLGGDGTGDVNSYYNALEQMIEAQRAEKRVLVHCAAGAQRTGGVIACYRLLVEGWPGDKVVDEMKQYGWSETKDQAVVNYVNQHLGELATRLQQQNMIKEVPNPLPQLPKAGQ